MLVTAAFQALLLSPVAHTVFSSLSGLPKMLGKQTGALQFVYEVCSQPQNAGHRTDLQTGDAQLCGFFPSPEWQSFPLELLKEKAGSSITTRDSRRVVHLCRSGIWPDLVNISPISSLFLSPLLFWIIWTSGDALRYLSFCKRLSDLPAFRNVW